MTYVLIVAAFAFLFVLVAAWAWAICDSLQRNRETFWFWLMALVPPVSVPAYILNFYILGDDQRGLSAWRRSTRVAADRRELAGRLRAGDVLTIEERARLAEAFEAEGRFKEALEVLAPALDSAGESLRLQHLAARIFFQLGDMPRARSHAAYVIESDLAFAGGNAVVIWLQSAAGGTARAELLKVLVRAADKPISPGAFVALSEFLLPSDDPEIVARLRERAEAYLGGSCRDSEAPAALGRIRHLLASR